MGKGKFKVIPVNTYSMSLYVLETELAKRRTKPSLILVSTHRMSLIVEEMGYNKNTTVGVKKNGVHLMGKPGIQTDKIALFHYDGMPGFADETVIVW